MNEKKANSLTKLAIRTLFFCLVLTIFLSTTFLVMFPGTSSTLFMKLGAENLSSRYAKAAYDRSGEFDDLVKVYSRSVQADEYKIVEKYGKIFMENENFESFVEFQNEKQPQYEYREWVKGNYLEALCQISGVEKAVKSLEITSKSNYDDVSSIRYIAEILVCKCKKMILKLILILSIRHMK